VLWLAAVIIGFVEGYVLLPFGLAALLGAVFLTAIVVWRGAEGTMLNNGLILPLPYLA
jgi:hypothetical protein